MVSIKNQWGYEIIKLLYKLIVYSCSTFLFIRSIGHINNFINC